MRFDAFYQGFKPVLLTAATNPVNPFAKSDFVYDTRPDGRYGCLKPFKIPFGPKAHNASAVRTAVSL